MNTMIVFGLVFYILVCFMHFAYVLKYGKIYELENGPQHDNDDIDAVDYLFGFVNFLFWIFGIAWILFWVVDKVRK